MFFKCPNFQWRFWNNPLSSSASIICGNAIEFMKSHQKVKHDQLFPILYLVSMLYLKDSNRLPHWPLKLWNQRNQKIIWKSFENFNSCIDFQKKNDCRQFALLKYKSYFKVSDIQLHRCQLELQFWIALSHDSYTFFIDYYAIFKSSSFQNHIVILLIRNVYAL